MTTKAITFKLLPLTKSKRKRLLKMADNFQLIYNFTSMRLPSLQRIEKPDAIICVALINLFHQSLQQKQDEFQSASS